MFGRREEIGRWFKAEVTTCVNSPRWDSQASLRNGSKISVAETRHISEKGH